MYRVNHGFHIIIGRMLCAPACKRVSEHLITVQEEGSRKYRSITQMVFQTVVNEDYLSTPYGKIRRMEE